MKLIEDVRNMSGRQRRALFLLWAFIHTTMLLFSYLINGWQFYERERIYRWELIQYFYPFRFKIEKYDLTEYFVYVIAPPILYLIYKYYKSEDNPQ